METQAQQLRTLADRVSGQGQDLQQVSTQVAGLREALDSNMGELRDLIRSMSVSGDSRPSNSPPNGSQGASGPHQGSEPHSSTSAPAATAPPPAQGGSISFVPGMGPHPVGSQEPYPARSQDLHQPVPTSVMPAPTLAPPTPQVQSGPYHPPRSAHSRVLPMRHSEPAYGQAPDDHASYGPHGSYRDPYPVGSQDPYQAGGSHGPYGYGGSRAIPVSAAPLYSAYGPSHRGYHPRGPHRGPPTRSPYAAPRRFDRQLTTSMLGSRDRDLFFNHVRHYFVNNCEYLAGMSPTPHVDLLTQHMDQEIVQACDQYIEEGVALAYSGGFPVPEDLFQEQVRWLDVAREVVATEFLTGP